MAPKIPWISPEEFLDQESSSETRHMYHAGLVTAMAGGTFAHWKLSGNLLVSLHTALGGRGCHVGGSDLMFRTGSKRMLTYPDVMVICGAPVQMEGWPNVVTNPIFIAEVLSPSTEAVDRGAKSREYRLSPTLRQYALVSQDEPLIEFHTRTEAGVWAITEVSGLAADCEFSSLSCRIPMAVLYDGVLGL